MGSSPLSRLQPAAEQAVLTSSLIAKAVNKSLDEVLSHPAKQGSGCLLNPLVCTVTPIPSRCSLSDDCRRLPSLVLRLGIREPPQNNSTHISFLHVQIYAPAVVQSRVAYQGVPGAYSESAARKACPEAEPLPCDQFEVAFQALAQWLADTAVLPIENSLGGSIHTVFDLLIRSASQWLPLEFTQHS